MEKLLFFDVDTQNDFMNQNGALYVEGAEEIKPNLKQLIDCAKGCGIPVIASIDAHSSDDPEFNEYPPHCIKGTRGQQKIEETTIKRATVIQDNKNVPINPDSKFFVIEKTVFDMFSNKNTDTILESIKPDKCIVFGVATDICVKKAVEALLKRNYQVVLLEDAVRGINKDNTNRFFARARNAGVEILSSYEVLKSLKCLSH
jgi:nicotinamidase/pyrazinamidase